MFKQEIEKENQGNSNEEEKLQQAKEDLRKKLIKNTQLISNLSVKDVPVRSHTLIAFAAPR
jgi:hypothetical protein